MCGIAGSVGLRDGLPPPSLEDLGAMVGALRHRGPDESGLYRDRRAALGHARLSIIDLATGQQPLCNEDRLGVRPRYLCEHGGRLWFASEVKAIFADDLAIPRALDPVGLAERRARCSPGTRARPRATGSSWPTPSRGASPPRRGRGGAGVLSTALLHEQLVRRAPARAAPAELRTLVDRLAGRGAVTGERTGRETR